jgi:hypothetical protein
MFTYMTQERGKTLHEIEDFFEKQKEQQKTS